MKNSSAKARRPKVVRYSSSYRAGWRKGRSDGYHQGLQQGAAAGKQNTLWPIALIVAQARSFPSLEIILLQPFRLMKQLGVYNYRVVLEEELTREHIAEAAIVVFIRSVEPIAYQSLEIAHEMGKPTVYVIDDNFLEIPSVGAISDYYHNPVRRETFKQFLKSANLIQTISPYFADYIRLHYNQRVVCFPASVDFNWMSESGEKPVRQDGTVVFGYEGTVKEEDFKPLVPAIIRILQEYGARVRVEFMGFIPLGLQGLPGVSFLPYDHDYRNFMHSLYRTTWDFGLAPLSDSMFNLCKTNNKFREYAACMIPGIYTKTPAYSDCVINGVTGLLVPHTTDDWYLGMKRMIDEPQLRQTIREQAGAYSRSHFSLEQSVANWRQHILLV